MSSIMTSTSLVESIKSRASIPESQSTYTFERILEFADEETSLALVPEILTLHEDYLLFEVEVPLVANQQEYRIPARSVGSKLRDVQFLSSDGNKTEMTRIGIGDRFTDFNNRESSYLKQFYIKNNKVVLVGDVGNSPTQSLIMVFYIQPSKLVAEEDIGIVKSISAPSGGTVTITFSELPEKFRALNDLDQNQKYDFYSSSSPNTIIKKDIEITSLNATTNSVTINEDDLPYDLNIGDHMAFAGECSIPQVPSDLHPMLAQLVACRILEAQGDTQGLQNALAKLQQMQRAAGMIIDNRVEDAPQKIVNRHSILRTSAFSRWFNRNR